MSTASRILAARLLERGNPAAAAVQAREAVRFDPGSAEAHNLLGVALASQGVYAEAAQEFRQTLRLDPRHQSAKNNMDRALAMYQQTARKP